MTLQDWDNSGEQTITSSLDPKVMRLLTAIANGESISIRYHKPDEVDVRSIKPTRVFQKLGNDESYVEAYCLKNNAERVFKVRRIAFLDNSTDSDMTFGDQTVSDAVFCDVEYAMIYGDSYPVAGVLVTCKRCGSTTDSFGQGPESIRRCMALLRENCPRGENNLYLLKQ